MRVVSAAGSRLPAVVAAAQGVAARALSDCRRDGGTPAPALAYAGRRQAPREEGLAALPGARSDYPLVVARRSRRPIASLAIQLAALERQVVDARQPPEAALDLLVTLPGSDR